jgi:hypothetical protein
VKRAEERRMKLEIPEYMHERAAELLDIELETTVASRQAADRKKLWAVVLGLIPEKDGNQWSVLWGPNMMEGVCSFGDTPEEAMVNFEKEMAKKIELVWITCATCGKDVASIETKLAATRKGDSVPVCGECVRDLTETEEITGNIVLSSDGERVLDEVLD